MCPRPPALPGHVTKSKTQKLKPSRVNLFVSTRAHTRHVAAVQATQDIATHTLHAKSKRTQTCLLLGALAEGGRRVPNARRRRLGRRRTAGRCQTAGRRRRGGSWLFAAVIGGSWLAARGRLILPVPVLHCCRTAFLLLAGGRNLHGRCPFLLLCALAHGVIRPLAPPFLYPPCCLLFDSQPK